MSVADDVSEHIHGSLIDLRRRLDVETAIEVSRAVLRGAQRALHELSGSPIDEDCDDGARELTVTRWYGPKQ